MLQLLAASLLTAKQQLIYFIFIKFIVSTPSILRKRWWCLTMVNASCVWDFIFLNFSENSSFSKRTFTVITFFRFHKKTFWTLFFKKDFRSNHHQNLCFLGGHICFCLSMCLSLAIQKVNITPFCLRLTQTKCDYDFLNWRILYPNLVNSLLVISLL